VKEEIGKVIDLVLYIFKTLNFNDFLAQVSLRDPINREKYIGTDENWEKAELAIQEVANEKGLRTVVEYGEAAFYGPKLDFIFQDALEREWQLGTVQVDYNLPERFDLEYVAEDGSRQRPVMIHRAPFGSLERLIGILIEEYAGDFPLWLAPVQVRLFPVNEDVLDFANSVVTKMQAIGVRAELDTSGDRLGKMIRNGEVQKVPIMAVVGTKEVESHSLSIRTRQTGDLGSLSVESVLARLKEALGDHTDF
jgi:threonyl-tRNA synthetase